MGAAEFRVVKTDPPEQSKGGRPAKYPWETLPVGHSFFVEQKGGKPSLAALRSQASSEGKKRDRKFSVKGSDAQGCDDMTFQVYRSE